jgi:uncharacterized protein with FMN-binding domain
MRVSRPVGAGLATLAGVAAVILYPTSTSQPALAGAPVAAGTTGAPLADSAGGTPTTSGTQPSTPPAPAPTSAAPGASSAAPAPSKPAPAPAAPAQAAPAPAAPAPPAAVSGTFTGDVAQTRWGPVQVQITVTGGKVAAADAIRYPTGNSNDHQINAYAIPMLNREAVGTTTGRISAITGATVTSGGYIASLQSAIDKAFHA